MTATYLADENCLQELPDRERPNINDFVDPVWCPTGNCQAYHEEMAAYYKELAKCRRIPCSPECVGKFIHDCEYGEGIDYEIKGAGDWKWCTQLKGHVFAAPIVPVKSEDELWREMLEDLFNVKISKDDKAFDGRISELNLKYSLTKR